VVEKPRHSNSGGGSFKTGDSGGPLTSGSDMRKKEGGGALASPELVDGEKRGQGKKGHDNSPRRPFIAGVEMRAMAGGGSSMGVPHGGRKWGRGLAWLSGSACPC
jgi:hypothetical protein